MTGADKQKARDIQEIVKTELEYAIYERIYSETRKNTVRVKFYNVIGSSVWTQVQQINKQFSELAIEAEARVRFAKMQGSCCYTTSIVVTFPRSDK
jgi:hypothetical protein